MKRRVAFFAAVLLMFTVLTGCNSKERVQGNDDSSGAAAAGSFSAADIALDINGKTYRCGDDVAPLLKELGDGYEYSEAISCAYDGLDKTYTYDNVDVYTYPDGDIDRVSEITAYGTDASTPKGLKVGDTVERMEELYGAGYSEEGITRIYEIPPKQENAQGASLYVTLDDSGKIQSIAITAEMLME
jgi:predicted small secreted protein